MSVFRPLASLLTRDRGCAAPDADQRREMQSLTLEALFEAIFRVLKHATASGAVMTATLGALSTIYIIHSLWLCI